MKIRRVSFKDFLDRYLEAHGSLIGLQYRTDSNRRIKEITQVTADGGIYRKQSTADGRRWQEGVGVGERMGPTFLNAKLYITVERSSVKSLANKGIANGWVIRICQRP